MHIAGESVYDTVPPGSIHHHQLTVSCTVVVWPVDVAESVVGYVVQACLVHRNILEGKKRTDLICNLSIWRIVT